MSTKAHHTAYSYLRFSSPEQAKGDSLRRQIAARDAWLAVHPDVTLDKHLKMTDAGRSAFNRKDWDTYALARFVKCIESGDVAPGSYLLLENLDRLSREHAGEALELFLSIVNRGIVIVQLMPTVLEFAKPVDAMKLMYAICELGRGHSESAAKSERGGKVWTRKQAEASERIVTRRTPGWVKCVGRKLVLDPDRAELVRRIYRMALDGMGGMSIAKTLNEERIPVMGRAVMKGKPVEWSNVGVHFILTTRAVLGEYRPYATDRNKPTGEVVPNYYPPVIDEATFQSVQAALAKRAVVGRGRRGKHCNLFAGLLKDWRDDEPLTYRHDTTRSEITAAKALQRNGEKMSFPVGVFEEAILSQLREVTIDDIQGNDDTSDKLKTLKRQIAELDVLLAKWEARMDDVDIHDMVAKKLGEYSAQRRKLVEERDVLEREAASPMAKVWGEAHGLIDLLKSDTSDETRLRLRSAIQRTVESVQCVFFRLTKPTPLPQNVDLDTYDFPRVRSSDRIAIVNVRFHGEAVRTYVIALLGGKWFARSFESLGFQMGGKILKPGFVLPDSMAKRFRWFACGHDAQWKCTACKWQMNPTMDDRFVADRFFGDIPILICTRKCPACKAPVVRMPVEGVTSGEVTKSGFALPDSIVKNDDPPAAPPPKPEPDDGTPWPEPPPLRRKRK